MVNKVIADEEIKEQLMDRIIYCQHKAIATIFSCFAHVPINNVSHVNIYVTFLLNATQTK
jgi:hypothetical protein